MISTLSLLAIVLQVAPVDLTLVTVPVDSRVDIPLSPNGEVEVRREETLSRIKVELDEIAPLTGFGTLMRAYVVWAVSPEAEVQNLGELEVNGRKAELETTTQWQRFGILVTAEPYSLVEKPSSSVAFRSIPPRNRDIRVESVSVAVGEVDYSTIQLPPQGGLPARFIQARMALKVAEAAGARDLAAAEFREARVALEAMEELLRRSTPLDVLIPYVNDAIRLSDRAVRAARTEEFQLELREATRRGDALSREKEQLDAQVLRLSERQLQSDARLEGLLSELQEVRDENRTRQLEQDDTARQLRAAETEIAALRDPWPPLTEALLRVGARETPRGLVLTLPADHFRRDTATLESEARELLARLAGALTFGREVPEVWIEAHTTDAGAESRNLTLSEERAETVRLFLAVGGMPEASVRAEGFGSSRPLPGTEESGQQALNERVEIVVREFQPQ